jgi:hypothetical protein
MILIGLASGGAGAWPVFSESSRYMDAPSTTSVAVNEVARAECRRRRPLLEEIGHRHRRHEAGMSSCFTVTSVPPTTAIGADRDDLTARGISVGGSGFASSRHRGDGREQQS